MFAFLHLFFRSSHTLIGGQELLTRALLYCMWHICTQHCLKKSACIGHLITETQLIFALFWNPIFPFLPICYRKNRRLTPSHMKETLGYQELPDPRLPEHGRGVQVMISQEVKTSQITEMQLRSWPKGQDWALGWMIASVFASFL